MTSGAALILTAEETAEIADALVAMSLAGRGEAFAATQLSGGVSCDVYRVALAARTVCLKRALPRLRVAAEWRAPASRSSSEVAWLRLAAEIAPGAAPAVLGEDSGRHMFAMEFFPPDRYPVWKALLAAGNVEPEFAGRVGAILARFHAATAGRSDIARAFANDAQFFALRLEPYFLHMAARHGDVAADVRMLVEGIAAARVALMHGDVSPKNILRGPGGPVFLDAETACYGDPAFDLAFCLNHLLLKCVWHPQWRDDYQRCFAALKTAYLRAVDWERPVGLEARTARLLPAFLLARIDGKSPVEYLTDERDKAFVRENAKHLLLDSAPTLDDLCEQWGDAVTRELA